MCALKTKTTSLSSVFIGVVALILIGQSAEGSSKNWRTDVEWSRVNFTWPSHKAMNRALSQKTWVPENVIITGIKTYGSRMYVALPRVRPGVPVTLAYFDYPQDTKTNPLLVPYPSWDINELDASDCSNLISVHSMEIDKNGQMWVVDGMRVNPQLPQCPPKLLIIDLKSDTVIRTFNLPKELSESKGGFLNDIVVDNTDGDYAYMTETSSTDPGLIVYSRLANKAWKLRDSSMFAERALAAIRTGGLTQTNMVNLDGIALSPLSSRKGRQAERYVYYSALAGFSLYRISTTVLKDQELAAGDFWRRQVSYVGNKTDATDGMIMDNKGILYFGVLNQDGIGKWQSRDNLDDTDDVNKDLDTDINDMIWPHSFTMDNNGNVFVIANQIHKYFSPTFKLVNNDDIKFRIFKLHTGAKSYLYSN